MVSTVLLLLLAEPSALASSVEERIAAMSDREKVAQLLFVGVPGRVEDAAVRELAGEWHVGGVVLYAHNIETPEQVRRLNEAIARNAAGGVAPFIAIDQEGGIVHRLRRGVPVIPSAMAIGATRSPELARRAGRAVGNGLRTLGFTMNFAPVLDVLTSHESPAIGTRAFADDPQLVATLGAAFIRGQQEAGVLAVGKHFPGLGAVADDPHHVLPRLPADASLLKKRELVPFAAAFRADLSAVMTAHVAVPAVSERADLPATFSRRILKGFLRDDMGFTGIVISDALQMDALARKRGAGALALDAILAGSDMVLALGSARERRDVLDTLLGAYRDGRLPERRVHEALRRILTAKNRLGQAPRLVADEMVIDDIASSAVTHVAGSAPLPDLPDEGVLFVGPAGALEARLRPDASVRLSDRVERANADAFFATARARAASARIIVAAASNHSQFALVSRLRAALPEIHFVFVNLGSPWRVLLGERSTTLLTYAEDPASQTSAARVILGEARAKGIAPVALD